MTNVRYKHNYINFGNAVLKSDKMAQVMRDAGNAIQARCGDGYVMRQKLGNNRQMAIVIALSKKAQLDNSEHNTLLKALY